MQLLIIESAGAPAESWPTKLPAATAAASDWDVIVAKAWPAPPITSVAALAWRPEPAALELATIRDQLRPWLTRLPICVILPPGFDSLGLQLLTEGVHEYVTSDEPPPATLTPAALAAAVQRAWHRFQGIRPAEHHLTLLNEITASSSLDSAAFLQKTVRLLRQVQAATACFATIWDDQRGLVRLAAQYPPVDLPDQQLAVTPDKFLREGARRGNGADEAPVREPLMYEDLMHEGLGYETLTGRLLRQNQALIVAEPDTIPELTTTHVETLKGNFVFGLPLQVGQQPLGALLFAFDKGRELSVAEQTQLKQIVDQVALTLANARLFEATRRQLDELHVLNAAARAGSELLDESTLLEQVTAIIGDTLYPDNFGILLLDEETQILTAHPSYRLSEPQKHLPQVPVGTGVTGHVALTGEPFRLAKIAEFDNYLLVDPATLSELCVPIKTGATILGVINAESQRPNSFTKTDERMLTTLAGQLAVALQRIRLFTQMQERSRDLAALVELSVRLRPANSVDEVLDIIMPQTMNLIGADKCRICLVESETGDIVTRGIYPHAAAPATPSRYRRDQGITGYVIRTGALYYTSNLQTDPHALIFEAEREQAASLRSLLALPLRAQEWICGVIHIAFEREYHFSQEELSLLTAAAEIAGNAIDRALVRETLELRVAERTEELAAMNERLQDLDRLKSKFISDVSHELRTPVTSLRLYLDLLDRGQLEKRDQYLTIINQQTDRLGQLVESILSLSRIDLGRTKRPDSLVDFNETVRLVVAANDVKALAAGLNMSFAPGDIPAMEADVKQLEQIVSNLIANALNYTPAGFVHIGTFFDEESQQICLTVTDSGNGISEEDLPHIFERFYRGAEASQSGIPGHGLGLALVYELVHLHHGQVDVDSVPGQGTSFTIWLPPRPPAETPPTGAPPQ